MAYLSRQVSGGFVAGNKLFASQLNNELNHLIAAFVGNDNRNIKLKYNDSDEPTLELWNSGGNPLEIRVGGGEDLRLHVDSDGTLVSAVATGTAAPITVASTAVCTNLNADFIDGHELANLVQTDKANQIITHASAEVNLKFVPTGQGENAGSARIYFDVRDTDVNVDALWRMGALGTDDTFRLQQYDDSETAWIAGIQADLAGAAPFFKVWDALTESVQQVATTKSRTIAQVGVFYEGVAATAAKQATFIASDGVEELIFTKAKYVYRGGTPDEDTLIQVKRYDTAGDLQQTIQITVVQEDTVDLVYDVDISDVAVGSGESLVWTITQTGVHEDISVWLMGTQEIKT
jgi:hypothetical protein